jgi:hypothetical protein
MDMINYPNRRKPSKVKVRWPVIMMNEQGRIPGESRIATHAGIFIVCHKELTQNETYQVVIRPSPETPAIVSGKPIFSNLDRANYTVNSRGSHLYFLQVSEQDHPILEGLLVMAGNRLENVETVTLKLRINSDQRSVEKEFSNLFDVGVYMGNFFSLPQVADRRKGQASPPYSGRERRMRT